MNPIWLKTFMTLIDTRHFTKTAEKLFMTQPGVTQHIKKLEEACRCELIIRDKKSFSLTEQGKLVYQYAQAHEIHYQQLLNKLSFDDPFSGSCHIGASGSLANKIYPELLDLQVNYPELVIQLHATSNKSILDNIANDTFDIGLTTKKPDKQYFDCQEFGYEILTLVLPKQFHNLSNPEVFLNELKLISHPDCTHYLSLYTQHCGDIYLSDIDIHKLKSLGTVNQLGQILTPVVKGLAYTVLPKHVISHHPNHSQLHCYEAPNQTYECVYLISKKGTTLPARFSVIIEQIKNCLSVETF
ncbi:LysR family transcriptional regulator [Vibrio sp.]|nr:LysR family transcriptional regulator [Vibrio sp.]